MSHSSFTASEMNCMMILTDHKKIDFTPLFVHMLVKVLSPVSTKLRKGGI